MRDADPRPLDLKPWLPPFLLGFLASASQIYLLREFSAEFFGNEIIFGLFLGSWLLWGAAGSLVRSRRDAGVGPSALAGLYGLAVIAFFAGLVLLRFSHHLLGILPAELAGLGPALGFALLVGAVLSLPLGHGFVLNARLHRGGATPVYILESLGAAAAGLIVHFGLIPYCSNWRGAALVGAAIAIASFVGLKPGRAGAVLAAALALSVAMAVLDRPAQKAAWRPLQLVETRDTRYGKLQVVRTADQFTLFDNGLAVLTHPDPGAAEEIVHFALLQRTGPRRVLMIGGGLGGGVAEALKYPDVRVDCLELDPAVIRLAAAILPGPAKGPLANPRVRVLARDGRSFLARATERYDAILLGLPEPSTAQINRFYTLEFFRLVRDKLSPGGVFSFVVPSSENYISAPLGRFLASLRSTLGEVFPEVAAAPGDTCVFLASDGPLTLDPARLSREIVRLGLDVRRVAPGVIRYRLDPARVDALARKITAPDARINRDLRPVSYYFHSVLWAGQFRGLEARLLRALGDAPSWPLLDLPLGLFALGLVGLGVRRRRAASAPIIPLAVMGFTSIAAEVSLFIAFQARFGIVYGRIPLLVAMFMAGLALGSLGAGIHRRKGPSSLAMVQGAFVLLLSITLLGLGGRGGEAGTFALLLGVGLLGGYLFVTANDLLVRATAHPGLGYGVDLLASFAGVILASALIIPLFGIPALILRLALLNALCLAFLLFSGFRR